MEEIRTNGKNYSYAASDGSILSVIMYRFLVKPLLKVFPYHIPANIITIISNSLVFLAFIITMQAKQHTYHFWWMIPVCIFLYLTGDYLDGEQARRSKTSSPLGEFLDHFLDSFVTGLLLCMMMLVYEIHSPLIISITLTFGYFAQASAFFERYKNGKLTFTKFSSTETILLLTLLTTIAGFKEVRIAGTMMIADVPYFETWIKATVPQLHLTVAESLLIIMWLCALISVITTLIRTKGPTLRYAEYIAIGCIVCTLTAAIHTSRDIIIATLVLFHVNYICSLLSSIVMKKKEKHPDFFLAVLMIIMTLLKIENNILTGCYFLYVLTATGIRASMFFNKNKHYWYWINPAPEDDSAKEAVKAEGHTSQY